MGKTALAIAKSDAPFEVRRATYIGFHVCVHEVISLDTWLVGRPECETDERFLQLLPYMTLFHKDKVFMYSRGGKGDEGRLIGALSIGIGGHVDTLKPEGMTLHEHLKSEARREYREEVGVEVLDSVEFLGCIYDPETPVGRVHLGLWSLMEQDPDKVREVEKGVIDQGEWLTLEQLCSGNIYPRLEPWSQIVVKEMHRTSR